jgi:hypothetical protein
LPPNLSLSRSARPTSSSRKAKRYSAQQVRRNQGRKTRHPRKAKWPEFKTCKYTTEAIVADGIDKGEMRQVCTEPTCPVHRPKKLTTKADASIKEEQEKRRREEALANATGIRVLQTIVAAVPVRLMKRDLFLLPNSCSLCSMTNGWR